MYQYLLLNAPKIHQYYYYTYWKWYCLHSWVSPSPTVSHGLKFLSQTPDSKCTHPSSWEPQSCRATHSLSAFNHLHLLPHPLLPQLISFVFFQHPHLFPFYLITITFLISKFTPTNHWCPHICFTFIHITKMSYFKKNINSKILTEPKEMTYNTEHIETFGSWRYTNRFKRE